MSLKISDFIIMSDVDKTLITVDGEIPERNITAINRFVAKGGRFAIASGRAPVWIQKLAEKLPINFPCALINGGVLYDFQQKKSVWEHYLPDEAKKHVEALAKDLPYANIIIMTLEGYCIIKDDTELKGISQERWAKWKSASIKTLDWREIKEKWCKVLFFIDEEDFPKTKDYFDTRRFAGVEFVPSDPRLYEMMPEGISKGGAIKKMCDLYGLKIEQFAAIGDFYNDADMIETAGLGVATAGAPDEIKAYADYITGPHENGAVADLIEYLEDKYE